MFGTIVRVILALVYLFAGVALILGRKRFKEEGKEPNFIIPAVLLVLACVTTLVNW